eukprot:TRINITY_DN547_c0_g3_i5.p2 TRINITY_DN547_c0_g3~~TRINITY_DN547_c0_g3_i5.p2  ORF type:complete len:101 (+),score=3.86 TRINITY_DN547_c0_g3_i5:35-304(+)
MYSLHKIPNQLHLQQSNFDYQFLINHNQQNIFQIQIFLNNKKNYPISNKRNNYFQYYDAKFQPNQSQQQLIPWQDEQAGAQAEGRLITN